MLVIIVIVCNLIIFIFNLYLIWKIHKLKKFLSKIADTFIYLEENCNLLFKEYSLLILKKALEINNINSKYKLLKKRNQQLKQLFILFRLGYQIYQQKFT